MLRVPVSGRKPKAAQSSKFIALLRAINVGGRTVRMEVLRELFGDMGFANVETFIASGNVIFDSTETDGAALEAKIERTLQQELGYDVETFIRTPAELAVIAALRLFPQGELDLPDVALYIGFLKAPLPGKPPPKLLALCTPDDDLRIHRRELHWLARRKMSESKISNTVLERVLAVRMTMRNITTVRKLAAKYAGAPTPAR